MGGRIDRGGRADDPGAVAAVIAFPTLEPGDVIATGTPESGVSLSGGDRVEVGIGTLANDVWAP